MVIFIAIIISSAYRPCVSYALILFLEHNNQKYLIWLFAFLNKIMQFPTITKMDDERTLYLNMLNRWNYHQGINFVFWKYKKLLEKPCFSELLDIQAPGVVNLTRIFYFVGKTLEYYHLSILPAFCKTFTGHSFICTGGGLTANIFIFGRKRWLWNRLEI